MHTPLCPAYSLKIHQPTAYDPWFQKVSLTALFSSGKWHPYAAMHKVINNFRKSFTSIFLLFPKFSFILLNLLLSFITYQRYFAVFVGPSEKSLFFFYSHLTLPRCGTEVLARVRTFTLKTPCRMRTLAHSPAVVPVVKTSSTRQTTFSSS